MILISMLILIPFMITFILILINLIFSSKNKINLEKPSPFECGFNPNIIESKPFSMNFYLFAIIFLIFDMEIILFTPLIISMYLNENLYYTFNTSCLIIFILYWGLFIEWNDQSMYWIK